MKYERETFDVPMGGSKEYRDNFDRIFGGDVKKKPKKKDGAFLTLDGPVCLREFKGGKEISCEEIDGEVVLKLILAAVERALERFEDGTLLPGAPGKVKK